MDEPMVGEGGVFTPEARAQFPDMIGEGGADFKGLDNIKDVAGLVKSFAETKKAHGQMGQKLDGALLRPGDEASDEDKSAFRAKLLGELGAPETGEGYTFPDAESLPPEVQGLFDEGFVDHFRELFLTEKVPAGMASKMIEGYTAYSQKMAAAHAEKVEAAHKADVESLEGDWNDEDMASNLRLATKALKAFADDDLSKKIDDAKLYDNPKNFDGWRQVGQTPTQLRYWARIGKAMGSTKAIPGEGKPAGSEKSLAEKAYGEKSPELLKGRK